MTADPLPNAADAEHLTEALRRSGPLGEASVCNVEVMASEPTKSGSHETRRWREMDSNSRSPVSGDTPQRPLITSLAIIFPQSSASPSHRRLRPRRGKILAPSRCMPLVRSMLRRKRKKPLAGARSFPAVRHEPMNRDEGLARAGAADRQGALGGQRAAGWTTCNALAANKRRYC